MLLGLILVFAAPKTHGTIQAYCKAHPTEYEAICNGIGPLAIPVPPPVGDEPAREDWLAGLSAPQRYYVEQTCKAGDFSTLCRGSARKVEVAGIQFKTSALGIQALVSLDHVPELDVDPVSAAVPGLAINLRASLTRVFHLREPDPDLR